MRVRNVDKQGVLPDGNHDLDGCDLLVIGAIKPIIYNYPNNLIVRLSLAPDQDYKG